MNSPGSPGSRAASRRRTAGVLVGGAYVPVDGRGVIEEGEHAGGEVGARDAEAAGQVAVDRNAVGSPGRLAGQRRRAEDRPVQAAGVDLLFGGEEVGVGVAEERAPRYGLEQIAQVGAFALVGDDRAADEQEPARAGL